MPLQAARKVRKTIQPFAATEVSKSPSNLIYALNFMRNWFQLRPTNFNNLSEFLHDLETLYGPHTLISTAVCE